MAQLHSKPKPKIQWSEETIRRRGVRAVVAAMRLNREHLRLSLEYACCGEQNRILREYVEELRALNEAARELIKRRRHSRGHHTKLRNTWINNEDFHSGNGS